MTANARPFTALALLILIGGIAPPARAQFSSQFNHLKCYKITKKCPSGVTTSGCTTNPVGKTVTLRNQFGVEQALVLQPVLLCVPTQKTCDATANCGEDPTSDPVDHFKCYKVRASRSAVQPVVQLTDQFGTENVAVVSPQLLCTPVLKEVIFPTTTTTTTTTNPPCTTGGCTPCGSCGHGECHAAGGGGGCGAPTATPECVDSSNCVPSTCSADAQCGAGRVCVFLSGASECCVPCP